LLLIAAFATNAVSAQTCDRDCLRTTLDQYLDAVVQHDTGAAPLFVGFRQTDNGVVVRPGTGTWQSITALGEIQRKFFDPVSGQAAYLGLIEEGQAIGIATLRLKVENRQITEAEWVIAREGAIGPSGAAGSNLYNLDGFIAEPPPERTVPQNQRASREALIAIANSYFDGLTTHDGSIIIAHEGCTRNENGTHTAGPAPNGGGGGGVGGGRGGPGGPGGTGDCTSGLTNFNVSLIAARRYPVVDVEQQAVVGFGLFLRKPGTTTMRNLIAEWFFVDDNRIRSIWASMFYPTNDLPMPNWPPYDGNFPVAAEFAAPATPAPAGRGRGGGGN
jgi:hypothetical protein